VVTLDKWLSFRMSEQSAVLLKQLHKEVDKYVMTPQNGGLSSPHRCLSQPLNLMPVRYSLGRVTICLF
jgi:hypothetical protein